MDNVNMMEPPGLIDETICHNGWQEPVEVFCVKGHRMAVVTHRCRKKLLHGTDHECECGRTWPAA